MSVSAFGVDHGDFSKAAGIHRLGTTPGQVAASARRATAAAQKTRFGMTVVPKGAVKSHRGAAKSHRRKLSAGQLAGRAAAGGAIGGVAGGGAVAVSSRADRQW